MDKLNKEITNKNRETVTNEYSTINKIKMPFSNKNKETIDNERNQIITNDINQL